MSSPSGTARTAAEETKLTAPYGSWKSPITADIVSGSDKRLDGFAADSLGRLFWVESRPTESGRAMLVKQAESEQDEPTDITPKDFAVRTVVQECGGGAFSILGDHVIFSNYKDQRLYKQSISSKDSAPVPLTPDYSGPLVCYADGVFDSRFNRYLTIVVKVIQIPLQQLFQSISTATIQKWKVNDFYAFPRIDHKGERLAWIEWGHPNMPWDRSELWVGYISENGDIQNRICVAGGDSSIMESPTEPKWSPEESTNEVLPVYSLNAEFTKPLWDFGLSSYDFLQSPGQKSLIACNYRLNGKSYLGVLDVTQGKMSLLDIPFTDINNIVNRQSLNFYIIKSFSPEMKPYISSPELIEFPTEVPGESAYAYFYPPTNPLFQASQDEKPPLLLESHGGPTVETRGILNFSIQYWTSRGWAFVDVNYGGSTGYGRKYRDRVLGRWGIVDVNDCCSCAKFLVDSGKVDGESLCITGGSAGGYTTLAALAFTNTFKAGASLYGVADLKSLRDDTHKFESHYIDNLVGDENAYFDRSPINFVDKFSCPIILFQGLEDKVVLPNQAQKIYRALKDKGSPVALVEYDGEQHGFRKAENIKFTLEQQMVFFARLVGRFQVADDITPIKVDNLD
ncbi:hypothetical protein BUALT_Bualt08G0054700 [Buddleja alternifolia]|uniref:Peptidase S9 prolyl oligopeptidase catalytic domain-containing protein n=1 Tax=Buddleja alternifolia TaxID=168488 RepID=A0AAV6XB59_9LAMI|nr:hypothetical protein BUALT_Bualt08G0054700 [Buddleja alternifolia]